MAVVLMPETGFINNFENSIKNNKFLEALTVARDFFLFNATDESPGLKDSKITSRLFLHDFFSDVSKKAIQRINDRALVEQKNYGDDKGGKVTRGLNFFESTTHLALLKLGLPFKKGETKLEKEFRSKTLEDQSSISRLPEMFKGKDPILWPTKNLSDPDDIPIFDFSTEGSNGIKTFPYYHPKGICQGECAWFVYLFNATKDAFEGKSIDEHFIAVAKEFEKGGPFQSAILQGMENEDLYKMLDFEISTKISLTTENIKSGILDILGNDFFVINVGHSDVELNHAILIYKREEDGGLDDDGYIIDLNWGPQKIEKNFSDKLLQHMEKEGHFDPEKENQFFAFKPKEASVNSDDY